MALTAILSWYEDISLDTLMNLRTGSPWVENLDYIAHRQACAYQLIEYANVHQWNEGPSFLPDEAEENVESANDDECDKDSSDEHDSDEDSDGSDKSGGSSGKYNE